MNMLKIRRILSNFKSFQYFMCVRREKQILEYKKHNGNLWIEALKTTKPVFINIHSKNAKIKQYMKAINRADLKFDDSTYFIHSIDEDLVLFQEDWVIDNMPLDYGIIVNSCINNLRKEYKENNSIINRQNLLVLDMFDRYIELIKNKIETMSWENERKEYFYNQIDKMYNSPASDLKDALQRILYWNQLIWQFGHRLNGLGRLDKVLDRIPVKEDSINVFEDFFNLLHLHYHYKSSALLGDIGQIVILGGIESDNSYFYNEYTKIILKVFENIKVTDPKALLRVSKEMPDELYAIASQCLKSMSGTPLISNDDIVIPSIIEFGYSKEDACNYGVSACWEPLVIGKSLEQNNLCNIEFAKAINLMITSEKFLLCRSFDDILKLYFEYLDINISEQISYADQIKWAQAPIFTLFTPECAKKEKDISQGGALYNNYGFLSVGMASAVDSLLNIKSYVFDKAIITLEELKSSINNNYVNNLDIKNILTNSDEYFGKDNQNICEMTNLISSHTAEKLSQYTNRFGGKIKFGLSSPQYIDLGLNTLATADGREAGTPFSTHISTKRHIEPNTMVSFAGKLDYKGYKSNGNVVDLFLPQKLFDDNNSNMISFLKGSVLNNIFQMQFNFLTYNQLVDAKKHPEKYPNLIVRVWGFSAYFNDLPEIYQDLIIERARVCEI